MIVQSLINAFREDMRDTATPYLWSDSELIRHINTARREICQGAWGISDLIELTFTKLQPLQPLPRAVTKVKMASAGGKTIRLAAYTEVVDPLTERSAARLEYLLTGITEGSLRAYPRPEQDTTVQMTVLRNPTYDILSVVDDDLQYELPAETSQGVLYWMRAMAYSKEDSETFDREQSDRQMALFGRFLDAYKHMHERREHQPGNVTTPRGDYW